MIDNEYISEYPTVSSKSDNDGSGSKLAEEVKYVFNRNNDG